MSTTRSPRPDGRSRSRRRGGRSTRSCAARSAGRRLGSPDLLGEATRMTFALATAYVLLAPYSLPWYELLTWALLPLLAPSLLDTVLLGRGAVMAMAYVPG